MSDISQYKQRLMLEQALREANTGNTNAIEELLQSGFNINIQLEDRRTALTEAVRTEDLELIKILVEGGADVNSEDSGYTALTIAAFWGMEEIYNYLYPLTSPDLRKEAEELLPKGLLRRERQKDTLTEDFVSDAAIGDLNAVLVALEKGVDVNAVCADEMPALVPAAYWGHVEIVQLLLEHGANANCKAEDDLDTPLISAAKGTGLAKNRLSSYTSDERQIKVIKLLLTSEADVNHKNKQGKNALMEVAKHGSLIATKILLQSGADVNAEDNHGKTALSIAKEEGHKEIIQMLKEAGAKDN